MKNLVLKCSIDSNPFCHQIRWFHNDKELLTQPCSLINRTQTITEYIIPNVYRIHSGKYTCEVKNWLNTGFDNRYEATTQVSTDVRIQCKILSMERETLVIPCRRIRIDFTGHRINLRIMILSELFS